MKKNTKTITICAMMIALSLVFMYIGVLLPSGRAGFMAVASLFTLAAVIECGYVPALCVFAASSILGFLIMPDKAPIMFYILFFGYYPVIKSLCEKLKSRVPEWIIKLAVFNIALTVMVIFFRELLMMSFLDRLSGAALIAVIYILMNIIFVIYDYGVSKLVQFYMYNIHNKIR